MSSLKQIYQSQQTSNQITPLSSIVQNVVPQNSTSQTNIPEKKFSEDIPIGQTETNQPQQATSTSVNHNATTQSSYAGHSKFYAIGLVLGVLIAGTALIAIVVVWQISRISTTTSSTNNARNTILNTSLSSLCVTSVDKFLLNNSFIYSPTSQNYAAGMLNNQFGVYQAYGYYNVTSTAVWTANQTSTSQPCKLALQPDRNLVVYLNNNPGNGSSVLWTARVNNNGTGSPFCLQMLDTGNLIWVNSTLDIIWQSNSTVTIG